jgi:hypothetical protein
MNTLRMSETTLPVILSRYISKDEQGKHLFDFEKIVPVGDVPDWHDQRLEKWGTKWVGYGLEITDASIAFYTAWTPPIPVLVKLAELHKDLVFTLEYAEPGMAFRGVAIAKWQNGRVLLDDKSWNMTEKDFRELGLW